jgi:hypothetical protein
MEIKGDRYRENGGFNPFIGHQTTTTTEKGRK